MLSFVFGRCDSYKELWNFQVHTSLSFLQKKGTESNTYTQKSYTVLGCKKIMQIFKFGHMEVENYQTEWFQKNYDQQIFRKIITQELKIIHIKNKTWFHHLCFFYFADIPESLKNSLNLKKIQSGKNWLWGIISHGCLAW